MTPSQALPAVLQKIDAGLDQSLERLFEFLRIQSISTDPAYSKECQTAAAYVAKDLSGIGFQTSIRQTEGHPIVVGKGGGEGDGIGSCDCARCECGTADGSVMCTCLEDWAMSP